MFKPVPGTVYFEIICDQSTFAYTSHKLLNVKHTIDKTFISIKENVETKI